MRDLFDFKDKVAVVTGGSRGIGRAICVQFAKLGANVVINYAGNETAANETAEMCEQFGVKTLLAKADVSSSAECEKLFETLTAQFGKIDILVNNAGITRDTLIVRMSEEQFDEVVDTNLKGTFLCMKNAAKIMMKQRSGSIINISSVVGIYGNAGQVNYAASKAGIIGMTKSLAKELGKRGVTVNAIAPGFIETEMTDVLSDEMKAKITQNIALARLGKVSDVARMVAFLSSDAASYITGQVFCIDGGMSM